MRIDQILPDFAAHDAIGNHVLEVRRLLRAAGWESDIWAQRIDPRVQDAARPYLDRPETPGEDILLYHLSTDCEEMTSWLSAKADRSTRLACYYHNITPAPYFARWEPSIATKLGVARDQMRDLAPHTELAIAASEYSETELIDAGYLRTAVSPLLVDLAAYDAAPDSRTVSRLRRRSSAGGVDWLFVGRIAPNKCQHDVIAAFAVYRRLFDPQARLSLIGGASSYRYLRALHRLAQDLEVESAVDLVGSVDFSELLAYYRTVDVFVCLSEHEGFGVPVLEAMALDLPVVAHRAAALAETAGAGARLLEDKDPLVVACAVAELLSDDGARAEQLRAGRARAAELDLPSSSSSLLSILAKGLNIQLAAGAF